MNNLTFIENGTEYVNCSLMPLGTCNFSYNPIWYLLIGTAIIIIILFVYYIIKDTIKDM
jgi:hypothetical protein